MSNENQGISRRKALWMGSKLLLTTATASMLSPLVAPAGEALPRDPDPAALFPEPDEQSGLPLYWLDTPSQSGAGGVSWGVPWPRGTVRKDQHFSLTTLRGGALPLTYRSLAYWPDGSVKWTAFDAVAPLKDDEPFRLAKTVSPPAIARGVSVRETDATFEIDTGELRCILSKSGDCFLNQMLIGETSVCEAGQLICLVQHQADLDPAKPAPREKFIGHVERVLVENQGPVRVVMKIMGTHRAEGNTRHWLPYTMRLYFYKGCRTVRLVYSFIFDGDAHQDFISAMGLQFGVPLREEPHNRHVRFSGEEGGLWSESVQPLIGREPLGGDTPASPYHVQLVGKRVGDARSFDPETRQFMKDWAVWSDYKLTQLSPDGMNLYKRTGPESSWLRVNGARRCSGLGFLGDVSGGLSVGIRHFWQSYPSSLEITGAASTKATLRAWLWSPDGPPMDLRHYDVRAHGLQASYEDVQPGFSTPHGIAHTSELIVVAEAEVPDRSQTVRQAALLNQPPLLRCTPQYYHRCGIFGPWSLPDTSTPLKRKLETQLNRMFSFYQGQIEAHRWYGFWNYGDIMHTYDPWRHSWKYDVGGFAWMNTEEMCDVWLWYSYLRTGRPEIFRMAEAMTRHTQEVDVYHIGPFKGLGSRHNVSHWGDGAKELRISQAFLKRFYFYLSTDERVGDLITEVTDADQSLLRVDPLREVLPPSGYPTHIRSGPDWLAAAGNWLAAWERTGDTRYRDRIVRGMKALAAMPAGLTGALSFGYDPTTHMLYEVKDAQPVGQFLMIMGGAEAAYELETLLDVPEWSRAWLELCEYWARKGEGDMAGPRAVAYAALKKNDARLGKLVWQRLAQAGDGTGIERFQAQPEVVSGPWVMEDIPEIPGFAASGHLSQWALNIIEALEMAGHWAPRT